jgi:hypothetical protein
MFEYETDIKKKWLEGYGLREDEVHLREAYRRAEAEQRRTAGRRQGSRVKHLKDINLSWARHLRFATVLALKLFLLSLTALVHGIFPFIFISKVSDEVHKLDEELS